MTEAVGPIRKEQLEAYVACCKRSRKRIAVAGHMAQGYFYGPQYTIAQSQRVTHMAAAMRGRGMECYTTAMHRLAYAEGRFRAELAGLKWEV